jgi:uncharacterized protein (TIGR00288 family)
MEEKEEKKIAVLIDAENVSSKYIKLILDETSNYGTATYKRLYGDFQVASVKAWMKDLQEYAITPIFQYNYTHGKNASDSALIIDAMDILYSGNVDGFCIVTSDSDFTKLVLRLRESGMTVIGMGEQKTPTALVSACEAFKFLDILYGGESAPRKQGGRKRAQASAAKAGQEPASQAAAETLSLAGAVDTDTSFAEPAEIEATDAPTSNIPSMEEMGKEIISIINTQAGEDGWVNLSELGDNLPKRVPGFDPRNYGCSKLRLFIEKFDSIEMRSVKNPHNNILSVIYVRVKQPEESEKPAKRTRTKRKSAGKTAARTAAKAAKTGSKAASKASANAGKTEET